MSEKAKEPTITLETHGKKVTATQSDFKNALNLIKTPDRVPVTIRITKIKYGGDIPKMTITYDKKNSAGTWDTYAIESREEPNPDFFRALEAMDAHLVDMCEQDDQCEAKSVTITWSNDIMGCVISGQRVLRNSHQRLNISTPHKTEESYSDHVDEKQLLSDECVLDLGLLMLEAWRFINGKRAQADLFEGQDVKEPVATETYQRDFDQESGKW